MFDNGKPVAGATMGMVQKSRESSQFLGAYQVDTDAEGRFTFLDMPPGQPMYLYGQMKTFPDGSAPAQREVTTGEDGSVLEVGDVELKATHRVAGRLVLGAAWRQQGGR